MRRAALIAAVVALGGCGEEVKQRTAPDVAPLRAGGDRYVGVAVQEKLLEGDGGYAKLAGSAFGAVTPENEMKWERLQPERGKFRFEEADRIVAFAAANGQRVRGHTLVWHLQNPGWVGELSRAEARAALRDHITRVMGHFRGRVAEWDVVNEAVADDGQLRDSPWLRAIGPGYIALAFRIAREADPQARLFYNDYGAEGEGPKARGVLKLLQSLRADGVPIDGVGLQGHVNTDLIPQFRETLASYAALDLDIVLTEVDVRLRDDRASEPEVLAGHGRAWARIGRACVRQPRCRGLVVWGLDDRDSWVPGAYPGEGAATLFDGELRPKPAYEALRAALAAG